jgi:hypothetical protein
MVAAGLAACGDGGGQPAARGVIERAGNSASAPSSAAVPTPPASTQPVSTPVRPASTPPASTPVRPVNRPPTIRGTPTESVLAGASFSFRPTTSDPDGDVLTFDVGNRPRWASFDARNGRLYGMPGPGDVGLYEDISISTSDGTRSASLAAFSVNVVATALGTITVSWTPSTEREDGSPLTNVGGHRIYWGTKIGEYPNVVSIDNPGITTYVVDGLVAATYYLAATTFDSDGVESELSAPVTVAVR